jgi:hypothetical protein
LLGVLPVYLWRYHKRATINAIVVNAIAHGSPEFRKILDLIQNNPAPTWTAQPIEDRREAAAVNYAGFQFLSDAWIVDMRDWRKTNDIAHFYRMIRVRKLAEDDHLVLKFVRPFDRIDFHCGPEALKPTIRRVLSRPGERDTTWELAFDFSSVDKGRTEAIEIEATVHDIMAKKSEGENFLRYRAAIPTAEASVWMIFPADRPYTSYNLVRYPVDDPSTFQKVDTSYTIDLPRGTIVAWSIINPEIGYFYECNWEWGKE